MKNLLFLTIMSALFLSGCYHAKVSTGLPAGPEKIDIPWAHSFIGGLVPPTIVEAASKCASGVSMVETQMSFPNLLANALTGGLYSPMHITVTCAATGRSSLLNGSNLIPVPADATDREMQGAIQSAIALSRALEVPVYLVQE
jgi:hypothetical protein